LQCRVTNGENRQQEEALMSSRDRAARRRTAPSTLHQHLKGETVALHQQLEAELGLLEPDLSIHRYCRVLCAFYGYYAPVEVRVVRLTAASPPLGFPLRARAELIESDLLALGLSRREIAELPRCTDLPRLSCPEDLAGCLYVLEGASLGGQIIAPTLRHRFGVVKGSGASFFIGDAEATSARWILVLAWLEGLARGGAQLEEIVASARATFLTLARWVEQQGASRQPVRAGEAERHGRPDRL
jgi:heme oxygenase (biliverdin-IX-beta and delta-forming)